MAVERPDGLRDRGVALWDELATDLDAPGRVLLGEACRLTDRLDQLDELLRGDIEVWARLTHRLLTEDYELKIDGAASEARQSAAVLRQLLAQLAGRSEASSSKGGSLADELAKRRAARGSGA